MANVIEFLGNIRGPQGPQGDTGSVDPGIQTTGAGRLSDLGAAVSSTATFKDLDLLPATSGWFRALSTALNRPAEGAFSVLHMAYGAAIAVQIATSVSGTGEPATYVRVKRSDAWTAWTKLTTPGDLSTRIAGLIPELSLASSAIVAPSGRWADLNAVDAAQPVLLEVYSTALNRPVSGFRLTGWHIPSETTASQLLVSSSNPPHIWTRTRVSGEWTDWQQIVDASILNTRVSGLPNEIDLMVAVPETEVTRSSRTVVPMTFRDKTRNTFYPAIYPAVYPAISWSGVARRRADVPVLRADGTLAPEVIPEIAPGVLTGLQVRATESGPLVLEVREDGKTYVQGVALTPGGGGSGDVTVRRVVTVAALGQSNQVAHGQPVVPLLDGASDRIWQLPDGGATLVPAVVPLSMPGETATGLSPSHVLAREIALRDPECVVVIVPASKGGSGLVDDPAMGYGSWAIDYTGSNPRLYTNALGKMTTASSQIAARWPGVTPSVVATWIQGEADGASAVAGSVYQAALDALIADWYSRFGGIFLIAGIVPQAATSGTRPAIVNVLEDTPRRIEHTAFVPGVDNGGGARGASDVIHYGREAVEIIGRAWHQAIPRASNNVASSYTSPPVKVTATRWGSEVTVEWTPPYCRVSAFEVQSSTDGSTWAAVAVTKPVAARAVFTSSVPVKVRVRAIGSDTSNWTAPVNAIG